MSGNSMTIHRVLQFAGEHGLRSQLQDLLYHGYFSGQKSVFDHNVLVSLAVEAGLDQDLTRQVLAGNAYADAVTADAIAARNAGANGVPFYLIDGRHGLSGAQPEDTFLRALTAAWN
jgi:predicted DsbA family dithiol-disulfide isomerase